MIWNARLQLLLAFCIALVCVQASPARPVVKTDPGNNNQRTTTSRMIPPGYTTMPKRTGKTVGLAIVPTLSATSDDAEKAIHDVIGHIPGLNMSISLNGRDPLYLFKFLKKLKDEGKKVDLILIGGHSVQMDKTDEVLYINTGNGGQLTPASIDADALRNDIEQLERTGGDPVKKKYLCERLKTIREGSAAVAPGAQLIVHSCYLGSDLPGARPFLLKLGTAILGTNGGTVIGPHNVVGSAVVGNGASPNKWLDKVTTTMVIRSVQICQSLKAGKMLHPGDAFISTNAFTEVQIPAGSLKKCQPCEQNQGKVTDNGMSPQQRAAVVRIADEITSECQLPSYQLKGSNVLVETEWSDKDGKYSMSMYVCPYQRDQAIKDLESHFQTVKQTQRRFSISGNPAIQAGPYPFAPSKTVMSQTGTVFDAHFVTIYTWVNDSVPGASKVCADRTTRFIDAAAKAIKNNPI